MTNVIVQTLRRLICLLTAMLLLLAVAGADDTVTPMDYASMPAEYRALFEAEMASALANARARTPDSGRLKAQARGDFNGYTGTKADNSLRVEYRVSDSVVAVGEKVTFYVTMYCNTAPIAYTYGGAVMDEAFNQTGTIVPADRPNTYVGGDDQVQIAKALSYTPTKAGFFNYVIIVKDGNGNMLALSTPTIQVYEAEIPPFDNFGTDTNIRTEQDDELALRLNLDKTQGKVGADIYAAVTFKTLKDPVNYAAAWTLYDEAGSVLDREDILGQTNAAAQNTEITFPYRPLSAGQMQFVITATDGDGNTVKINSTHIPVADGFYLEARLSKSAAMLLGDSVTASYDIHGHRCDSVRYEIGWECYDDQGQTLLSQPETVQTASGKSSFTPKAGVGLEFRVGATCEHFPDVMPVRVSLELLGGLPGDADNNNEVNSADALLVMQYAAGWSVALNKTNADVNASGGVDVQDALLILRYCAGESVLLQ